MSHSLTVRDLCLPVTILKFVKNCEFNHLKKSLKFVFAHPSNQNFSKSRSRTRSVQLKSEQWEELAVDDSDTGDRIITSINFVSISQVEEFPNVMLQLIAANLLLKLVGGGILKFEKNREFL